MDGQIDKIFDRIEAVMVVPAEAMPDEDKKECLKYAGAGVPFKVVLGSRGMASGRVIYTEPFPRITDEFIERLDAFIRASDEIFNENPDEFGKKYQVQMALPNGSFIDVPSRKLDYQFVVYALPTVVTSNFEVTLRNNNLVNRLVITTQYPVSNPASMTSRITVFAVTDRDGLKVYRDLLSRVEEHLDGFSKDLLDLLKSEKLRIPSEDLVKLGEVIKGKKEQKDPLFL